jgi:hypothetical protein
MDADADDHSGPSRPIHLTVDGESWEVKAHGGQFDFNWLSGAAEGYGFTSHLVPVGAALSVEQLEEMIREFMSNVNPETGHLD